FLFHFLAEALVGDQAGERTRRAGGVAVVIATALGLGENRDADAAHGSGDTDRRLHGDRHVEIVQRRNLRVIQKVIENGHVLDVDGDQTRRIIDLGDRGRREQGRTSGNSHYLTHHSSPLV